jgi:predicted permease
MFDYVTSIQVVLGTLTVVGLAILTGFLKMFTFQDINPLHRMIYLVGLPCAVFKQIAMRPMNWETWQPLVHAILTQITVHVVVLVVCWSIPGQEKYLRFLRAIFSCTYSSFFYGYPLVLMIWGKDYLYIPVIANVVHGLVMQPFHSYLIYRPVRKDDETSPEADMEDAEVERDLGEIDDKSGRPIHLVEGVGDKRLARAASQFGDNIDPQDPAPDALGGEMEEAAESSEEDQPATQNLRNIMLKSIFAPVNICVLLGIIWSVTRWKMPQLIYGFVDMLEGAVPATGLFCIGIFMWEHPLTGCNWLEVGMYLAAHFMILPLIAVFWAWIMRLGNDVSLICTIINAVPVSLIGYVLTLNCGFGMKSASFAFFWSNILFIGVCMVWIAVLKETHIFG